MSLRSVPPKKLSQKPGYKPGVAGRLGLVAACAAVLLTAWFWLAPAPGILHRTTPLLGAGNAARAVRNPAPAAALPAPAERKVMSASGVVIRLIRRPRLAVPDAPYGPAYDKLEPAARAGDTAAQYRLGLLLYECRDVPGDTATLEQTIERVYETRRRGGWDVDDPANEEHALRRRYEECEGVPPAARGQYRDWLKQSADAGLIEAQLDLPLHLPAGEYCQFLSECTPEQRDKQEALDREAVDYLGRARDGGSAMALWTFGSWYAEGEVLPQNDIEAYASFNALDQIFAASGSDRRLTAMLDDLRGRMRPADLVQADARTRELLSNPNCCVLGQ